MLKNLSEELLAMAMIGLGAFIMVWFVFPLIAVMVARL